MKTLIDTYQKLKPLRTVFLTSLGLAPHSCRHHPTCSQYTQKAITRYGTILGLFLGVVRVLLCNPLIPPKSS